MRYKLGTAIAHISSSKPSQNQENTMKAMKQINLYDLATVFIAFGMVIGLALK